jgi:hypothetical protein
MRTVTAIVVFHCFFDSYIVLQLKLHRFHHPPGSSTHSFACYSTSSIARVAGPSCAHASSLFYGFAAVSDPALQTCTRIVHSFTHHPISRVHIGVTARRATLIVGCTIRRPSRVECTVVPL